MLAISCYGHEPTLLRDSPASHSLSLGTPSSGAGAEKPTVLVLYNYDISYGERTTDELFCVRRLNIFENDAILYSEVPR